MEERESEFTGRKGHVLKYVGCAYACIVASQFVEALGQKFTAAAGPLDLAAAAIFAFAFVAYPLYWIGHRDAADGADA